MGFDFTHEYFLDISRKCRYNEKMAEFYERMADLEYDKLYPIWKRDEDRRSPYQDEHYESMLAFSSLSTEFRGVSEDIADYYAELAEEESKKLSSYYDRDPDQIRAYYASTEYSRMNTYLNRAKSIRKCMKTSWTSDYYRMSGVKVIVGVDRCRDRFCYNCQSMDALQRFHEYAPVIDKFSERYDIYHCVFSQPNVPGFLLNQTLDLMTDSFKRLVRFLDGKKKIRGLDLVQEYGFVGAVRALEVSQNDKDTLYHPHFHCLLVLKKGIDVTPKHRNRFSVDHTHRREDRLFSDFEIFLQRIWYLLMNNIKVTKANLENLPQIGGRSYPDGFSCYAENANGHYHEVFKYVTKGSYKNGSILNDFECFRVLYTALYRRKVYQTYGCFYGWDMNQIHEKVDLKNISDFCFNEILAKLNDFETPERVVEELRDILRIKIAGEDRAIRYISVQSIRYAFDECPPERREELKEKIIGLLWFNV